VHFEDTKLYLDTMTFFVKITNCKIFKGGVSSCYVLPLRVLSTEKLKLFDFLRNKIALLIKEQKKEIQFSKYFHQKFGVF